MPRNATLDDYAWLYEHGNYMPDGLKCARDWLPDIERLKPGTFLDWGGGRGHLCDYLNAKTFHAPYLHEPALGRYAPCIAYDYVGCFDVLEHLSEPDALSAIALFSRLAQQRCFLTIANMSDVQAVRGEPVELHITKRPAEWWSAAIAGTFTRARRIHAQTFDDLGHRFGFHVEIA